MDRSAKTSTNKRMAVPLRFTQTLLRCTAQNFAIPGTVGAKQTRQE